MTRERALYIVDVYVPNEGEPDSALELTILRVIDPETPPQVYVHTYIRPEQHILNRIRWNHAQSYGIERSMIQDSDYPSFKELLGADYLSDKVVVCFCSSFEPLQTLLANCHGCYSLLNMWQDVFAGHDDASQVNSVEQMLEYMGLPTQDSSNSHYTRCMKRCRAMMSIWLYLFTCKSDQLRPERGQSEHAQSLFWPMQNIPDPWYDPNAKELTDIPEQAICDYFSERLPEYVHWNNVCLYDQDWRFQRECNFEAKAVEQDAMLNFIFYRLFSLPKRLMVLTFYALCQKRTDYARIIALHQGQLNTLQTSVKEDFAAFVILHLTDFLLTKQKRDIICALVEQVMQDKFERQRSTFDFDELYKKHELQQKQRAKTRARGSYFNQNRSETEDMSFVRERLSSSRNIFWYRELKLQDEVLLRRFTIMGSNEERDECIDLISAKLNELIAEAKNPFSSCWLSPSLKQWIEFITGFAWSDLAHMPRPNDAPSLIDARNTLREIIAKRAHPYIEAYISNLKKAIEEINQIPEGNQTVVAFMFQGINYEFDVNKSVAATGFFGKLRKLF